MSHSVSSLQSSAAILAETPILHQLLELYQRLLDLPKQVGKSAQVMPVLARYRME